MKMPAAKGTQWMMYWRSGLLSALLAMGAVFPGAVNANTAADAHGDSSTEVRYRSITVDGVRIFYREAGDPRRPTILLLHGFSSSSHMFRDLMPLLADRFHLVAPDYPGFGHSDAPATAIFNPTFVDLEIMISKFAQAVELKSFILYMQDFGGPVGLRMAVKHPDWIAGMIVQNANAYLDGLAPQLNKPKMGEQSSKMSTQVVNAEFIQYLYRSGVRDVNALNPDAWTMDIAALQRPGAKAIQSALIDDYPSNLQQYANWQQYFRKNQPKTLIVWGKNDQAFLPSAAEAYRRDLKDIDIEFFDTGHFALEEDAVAIANAIKQVFSK